MRTILKSLARLGALAIMFPCALLTAFGRWEPACQFFAQSVALFPGLIGDYLRSAYYYMTLEACSLNTQISFGSYFAHSGSELADHVNIGAYCVIGLAHIEDHTFIGGAVQILSGSQQHKRGADGRFVDGEFVKINIGANCWIGASSVIMADVGPNSTVAAGSVVSTPIPAGCVAAGNPARIVRRTEIPSAV
jgi:acetyltransferase-like isoleucine patch superfamily enzyme